MLIRSKSLLSYAERVIACKYTVSLHVPAVQSSPVNKHRSKEDGACSHVTLTDARPYYRIQHSTYSTVHTQQWTGTYADCRRARFRINICEHEGMHAKQFTASNRHDEYLNRRVEYRLHMLLWQISIAESFQRPSATVADTPTA